MYDIMQNIMLRYKNIRTLDYIKMQSFQQSIINWHGFFVWNGFNF